jgi:hypothetical protein
MQSIVGFGSGVRSAVRFFEAHHVLSLQRHQCRTIGDVNFASLQTTNDVIQCGKRCAGSDHWLYLCKDFDAKGPKKWQHRATRIGVTSV